MPNTARFDRFDEQVLEKDGAPLHYWTGGNPAGPPLVLLHGAGTDHRTFAPQLPVLAPSFSLLAWDARGHGRSRPMGAAFTFAQLESDLRAVMAAAGMSRAILVGHSMGGNLAQEVALHQPRRVSALILMDCTRNTGALSRGEAFMTRMAPRVLGWYPWSALVAQMSHASSVRDPVRRYLADCFRLLGHRDFTRVFLETARAQHPDPAVRLTKPLLIVVGDRDPTARLKKIADKWADDEPDARYVLVPNAGHLAHQDNPELVNEVLADFLGHLRPHRRGR